MASHLRLSLAIILLASLGPGLRCAADPPVRKVTVVGTCILHVVPDEMKWSAQVSINDATLAKAKTRHDESLDAALKFIKSLGGVVQDLQTGGIRFDKQTYFPPDTDRSKPFSCSTQFTFTLTDFNQYGPICDALAKIDGLQVQSVDYATSKEAETREDALKRALLNGHDKANDLAVTANCYIDRPLEIVEQYDNVGVNPGMMNAFALRSTGSGTPAAVPGQIEISARVTVTYDLYYK
ncbi:MAG: SIMPL domain-containing protein [Methylacidiphilales bacterium]|nr:SIMPL domain-containing protein [Candidatus Methylacidiphilales bacterium]